MAELNWILLYLHLLANLVWIGSIIGVALVLQGGIGTARERGAVGLRLYQNVSSHAFGISLLAGLTLLLLRSSYYVQQTKFMYAKLPLAFAVIALHHVLGARAKHMAKGERDDAGPVGRMALAIFVLVGGVVFLILRKPF